MLLPSRQFPKHPFLSFAFLSFFLFQNTDLPFSITLESFVLENYICSFLSHVRNNILPGNLCLRNSNMLMPVSQHEEVRKSAAKALAVLRQGWSKTASAAAWTDLPVNNCELGEHVERVDVTPPAMAKFTAMRKKIKKVLDPRTDEGKILIKLGMQDNVSHKQVGVGGFFMIDDGTIKDVRDIVPNDLKQFKTGKAKGKWTKDNRGGGKGRSRGGGRRRDSGLHVNFLRPPSALRSISSQNHKPLYGFPFSGSLFW